MLEVRGTNLLADPASGGVVLNYRDITERRAALTALEAGRRFSQATLDALSAHVAVLEPRRAARRARGRTWASRCRSP